MALRPLMDMSPQPPHDTDTGNTYCPDEGWWGRPQPEADNTGSGNQINNRDQ